MLAANRLHAEYSNHAYDPVLCFRFRNVNILESADYGVLTHRSNRNVSEGPSSDGNYLVTRLFDFGCVRENLIRPSMMIATDYT